MIRLFLEAEEKNKLNTDISKYNHNKRVLNDAISCIVTETTDGIFDLELTYPLNDSKNLSQHLVRGEVIKCPISQTDLRGEQLFTIRTPKKNTKENRVTIYAQAKARRDLDLNMVIGMRTMGNQTRKQALQMLLNACVEPHNYTVGSLDTNSNTNINLGLEEATGNVINYLDINGLSPRTGLLSESENSIFKAFGGEIIFNNFEINMVDERGTGNTILIKSGKNLEELQQDIDDTDTENFATAILPCSADGFYLPNSEIIYSSNAPVLGKIFKRIVFDDVTAVNDTPEAINVVYAQLRERVQKKFDEGMDKLKINNTINFIQLANTEEYKNYASLEKCEIGNNVIVRYYKRDSEDIFIEATGRVVKIKFDVLKNKIIEVEVGERKKKSIVDTINATTNNISNINSKANSNTSKIKKTKKDLTIYVDNTKGDIERFIGETKDGILLSVSTSEGLIGSRIALTETAIDARVKSADYNAYVQVTDRAIQERVSKGDAFYAEMLIHPDAIINLIKNITNNKTVLDSSGFHVSGGKFDFSGYDGSMLIEAVSNGSVEGIRIGDESWSKDQSFSNVLIGGSPLEQYFQLSRLLIDSNLDLSEGWDITVGGTSYLSDVSINGTSIDDYIRDIVNGMS